MRSLGLMPLLFVLVYCSSARPQEADARALVKQVVTAVGGEEKLLKLFRITENLVLGADPQKKGSERVSVLEPPKYWWVGKRERVQEEKEPATFLVWAWTLGALLDPKSKLEVLPEIREADRPLVGIRISETITPPMALYFDGADHRLVRIDWRGSHHRFSNWKEHDGLKYPAKCVGHRMNTNEPWYFTEILSVERLKELPEGLKR